MAKTVKAFEERPFPNGPEPDGGFNRTGQLLEVGIPEGVSFEMREALSVKPYYLGREKKFYEQISKKYPMLSKVLKKGA